MRPYFTLVYLYPGVRCEVERGPASSEGNGARTSSKEYQPSALADPRTAPTRLHLIMKVACRSSEDHSETSTLTLELEIHSKSNSVGAESVVGFPSPCSSKSEWYEPILIRRVSPFPAIGTQ